jgi:hypothetical protein
MRRAQADYVAVEAALAPHQLRTLNDCAIVYGCQAGEWRDIPVLCSLAIALAVANTFNKLVVSGASDRQALVRTASLLDVDVETLLRRRRALKRHPDPG